jgi:hypothetical protein
MNQFMIEYYDANQAEDSDPDTAFESTADNTDDLETALAAHLSLPNDDDIRLVWLDRDGDADRWSVVSVDENEELGIAYISVDGK